jgi:threonine/homoserine/homoserine lactone efflux protein
VTLERWTAFVGVLVVVFTPGPDFAVVLRHALARSRVRRAIDAVTGGALLAVACGQREAGPSRYAPDFRRGALA